MKPSRFIVLFLVSSAFNCYAAAGFADGYQDHQQWIFPAYSYCLIFGLLILIGLFTMSLIWKTKTRKITGAISSCLIRHRILAIIATSVLWAIPLGLIGAVSWEIIFFMSLLPALVLVVAFPLCLVNRRFRERFMLSPSVLKWTFLISISAIAASLLFVILTNWNLLPGTEGTYLARPTRWHPDYYNPTHPYDSMKEIWAMSLLFIVEIPFAVILYWFGMLNRNLCKKLSEIRQRKRETFQDIYTGE